MPQTLYRLLGSAALAAAAATAGAQQAPIRWIVPYPAAGGTDTIARTVADEMRKQLGQNIIVENKAGAGTIIGTQALLSLPPDGQAVMSADGGTLAYNSSLYPKLPYDPERSFTYLGGMVSMPMILVARSKLPVDSFQALLQDAIKHPGKYTYASAGTGSPQHLAMEMLQQKTGARLTHVPYRGVAPAMQDVIGNQVDLLMIGLPGGLAQIRAGNVKPLGAATVQRLPELPELPTLQEAGAAGFVADSWQGLVAPAGMPDESARRLEQALERALAVPAVRDKLLAMGAIPTPMKGDEFRRHAADQRRLWTQVIDAAGIRMQ
ncbi:Bug family tripartite tricarboxylate transporter substrate binding protein [Achromobacter xylosoxidans]|uniref:Bug family tripartite tricarboxylate transporter substrate binding protein n=1 Tax=Alcaligenes xylosoxydans xylosoxydans TaxID=85698 RepID=UPI000B48C31C|nr:tripartite tricarboxylate transporter substrate binding protein [Achromobacter xylosoxidans]